MWTLKISPKKNLFDEFDDENLLLGWTRKKWELSSSDYTHTYTQKRCYFVDGKIIDVYELLNKTENQCEDCKMKTYTSILGRNFFFRFDSLMLGVSWYSFYVNQFKFYFLAGFYFLTQVFYVLVRLLIRFRSKMRIIVSKNADLCGHWILMQKNGFYKWIEVLKILKNADFLWFPKNAWGQGSQNADKSA